MPVTYIKIPPKCLNSKFNKHEQRLVVASMLLQINLPVFRSDKLHLKIRHFGIIKTHGNKKRMGILKYDRRRSKKRWKVWKKTKIVDKKSLLLK